MTELPANAAAFPPPLRGRARERGKPRTPEPGLPPLSGSPPQAGRERTVIAVNAFISIAKFIPSPVRRVEFDRFRKLALPAVAIGEQFRLVIEQFLAGLGREFEVRSLDDGVDRAGFLAQAAIDAFHHVDVIPHGAAGGLLCGCGGPPRRESCMSPIT